MIRRPISAMGLQTNNPTTQARYPCLKHAFLCDETGSTLTLTDSVGGVTLVVPTLTKGDGYVVPGNVVAGSIGGTLEAPGTTDFLILLVGNIGTNASLGSVASGGFEINEANKKASDGTTTITSAYTTGSGLAGHAVKGQLAGNLVSIAATASTYTTGGSTATTGLSDIASVEQSMTFLGNVSLYSLFVFHFADGLPADIDEAVGWMTAQHLNGTGYKTVYPGWIGLA